MGVSLLVELVIGDGNEPLVFLRPMRCLGDGGAGRGLGGAPIVEWFLCLILIFLDLD
tara:strand:- start:40 stop:210 length:171 start_codon:yes stop_codon:yes gene_type:complete